MSAGCDQFNFINISQRSSLTIAMQSFVWHLDNESMQIYLQNSVKLLKSF